MTEKTKEDIRYSYSRLELLEQCGFRYWLHYIEKNYSSTSSIALEFGTLVHSTEETIGNCIKFNLPIDYEGLRTNFAETCYKLQQKYPEDFVTPDKTGRTYTDKINFYLNTGIYRLEKFMKENPDLEIVGTEVKFKFRYCGNQYFRGSIDRVLKNKITGKYIVQDIKTWYEPKDAADLATPLQFVTYCIAMSEMYNCKPEDISCSYDLPLCDITQDAGTKGFIDRGCKKLDKLFERIAAEDYVPKPTQLCHWCEYCASNKSAGDDTKFLCPYFMRWTRENKDFTTEFPWMGMNHHKDILESYHKVNNIKLPEKDNK